MIPIRNSPAGLRPGLRAAVGAVLFLISVTAASAASTVRVVSDPAGTKVHVDGRDMMVFGMNWGYMPIGQNYNYSLWMQPDDVIEEALAREMPLLQNMGVNAIRHYVGIPPRWVQFIYERYGIYTMVNHPMARYGFTLDGTWIPSVDYSDPRLRAAVKAEILAVVDEFEGTPGLLMWLLGNENNYGLSWSSFEIEALPEGERHAARARHLYSLFGEITRAVKERDPNRPVAIANGDLQYIDMIAEECPELDVLGTNVYRGISARDLFQEVKDKLGIPVMFTEFGADAWNAKAMREDQTTQARYLIGQWREIYEQSAGKGRVGNAVGGFIFQWSDGWWKFGQTSRLDIHDTNASWPNAGYSEDYVEGENNMNEEWWGICAKGPSDGRGLYHVYPRAAYYALQRAFALPPYAGDTDRDAIRAHFDAIQPMAVALRARGDRASLLTESLSRVRVSGLRIELEALRTGGSRTTTPSASDPQLRLPTFRGFDQLQSFYVDFEARPSENVIGKLSINMLGNVPTNPIDEIFYENRGRTRTVGLTEDPTQSTEVPFELEGIERLKVYNASVSWDDKWFLLDGFYRTGHLHWGFEGDFFGLYRDAYIGENIDIYNGIAPVGFEIAFKKELNGLKVAFGPELWWGANPAILVKYQRPLGLKLGPLKLSDATGIYQEDLTTDFSVVSTLAVPVPPTRKATMQMQGTLGPFGFEAGGIWAGNNKIGDTFQVTEKPGGEYVVLEDEVETSDTFGGKAKLTWESGRWHWYAQGAYMGLVADAGPTETITFTDWHLKDTGSGNQANLITGIAVNVGNFQISPNFLWQEPIAEPVSGDAPAPGRPRNVLDDPFAVRGNREMVGAELILTYDQTPATWMWEWDNDVREDARLAASLGLLYRDFRTTQDAAIGILANGNTFAFPGAPPARDMWEVRARVVSRVRADTRIVANAFAGTGEPNGDDERAIHRYGVDARLARKTLAFEMFAKAGDWGPFDYHRDFNLTFPIQLMGDISHSLGSPSWLDVPQTRIGVRATWRSLDEHSPRYCPDPDVPDPTGLGLCDPNVDADNGHEWEIRSYLHLAL